MKEKILNATPDMALFGSIVGAYLLDRYLPVVGVFTPPLSYLGWPLILVGIVLARRSLAVLRNRASSDVMRTSQVLITNGLYSLSRNPLYVSELLIITGAAIILGSLTAFIAPVVYVMVISLLIIPLEESWLQSKFGAKYERYKHSVRRWL